MLRLVGRVLFIVGTNILRGRQVRFELLRSEWAKWSWNSIYEVRSWHWVRVRPLPRPPLMKKENRLCFTLCQWPAHKKEVIQRRE